MTAVTMVDDVRKRHGAASNNAEMVAAHLQDVFRLGSQTLHAAQDVVRQARRDTAGVLSTAGGELKRTLRDGVAQIGGRLARLATPTRKEEAIARKVEVKQKKQRKRAEHDEGIDSRPTSV